MEAPGTTTWGELLADTRRLVGAEARWIVGEIAGLGPEKLAGALGKEAPEECRRRVASLVRRRRSGEPLQYVLGSWGFRTLELMVDRRALIPRPETEQVVEVALGELDRWREKTSGRAPALVADLGTGSGAIALSIAKERTWSRVWGTDCSAASLEVSRANLASLGRPATRVRLAQGTWFEALPSDLRGCLAMVVSNPPYVAEPEVPGLPEEVSAWEPLEALVAGPTGLEAIRAVLREAPLWLAPGGSAVLEIAPHQRQEAVVAARSAGFGAVEVAADLAGRARVLVARA
jgi:release factor glutamine methyltransferase